MLKVVGSGIQLTRGDTAVLKIYAYKSDCGEPYYFAPEETVHVQVRTAPVENEETELVFDGDVERDADKASSFIWMISAEQSTIDAGVYYYDIQANLAGGQVCTFISGTLEILPEVTIYHE